MQGAPLVRDEHVGIDAADGVRQADHDSREDDQRHAVAHATLGDLFTQPHDEGGAGGERNNGQHHEADARTDDHSLLHTHQSLGNPKRLNNREDDGEVTGPLRNLAAPELAFFLQFLKSRHHHREQLQNDGCRDIRHDPQSKDGEPPDVSAREEIEESEDGPRRRTENGFPALNIDAGRGHLASEPVHRQQAQRKHEPLAKVGDAKDVRERFNKLLNHVSLPALLHDSRADGLSRSAGFLNLI